MSFPCLRGSESGVRLRRRAVRFACASAVGVSIVGCYGVAAPPQPVSSEMHVHLALAQVAWRAAVQGDFLTLRQAARQLSDRGSVEGVPFESRPHLVQLRLAAGNLAVDTNLGVAIRRTASLAVHCGACHAEVGGTPFPGGVGEPPRVVDGHAARADWVVGRLWEGVVGPSDARWSAGVTALRTAPLADGDGLGAERMEAAGSSFDELAGQADQATRADVRAAILGEVMTTCAGCHVVGQTR